MIKSNHPEQLLKPVVSVLIDADTHIFMLFLWFIEIK